MISSQTTTCSNFFIFRKIMSFRNYVLFICTSLYVQLTIYSSCEIYVLKIKRGVCLWHLLNSGLLDYIYFYFIIMVTVVEYISGVQRPF